MQATKTAPKLEFWKFGNETHIVFIDEMRNIRNIGVIWGVLA